MTIRRPTLALIALFLLVGAELLVVLGLRWKQGLDFDVIVSTAALVLIALLAWGLYVALRNRAWGTHTLLILLLPLMLVYEAYFPLAPLGALWKQYNVKRVVVSNYKETYLLSKRGNPKGIRISYDVVFPTSGGYRVTSQLDALNPRLQHFNLAMGSATPKLRIEPAAPYDWLGANYFARNTAYHFTEEINPAFLFSALYDQPSLKEGELCIVEHHSETLSAAQLLKLIQSDLSTRYALQIRVHTDNHLAAPHTALSLETAQYQLRTFFLSAEKEQARHCIPSPTSGWPQVKGAG